MSCENLATYVSNLTGRCQGLREPSFSRALIACLETHYRSTAHELHAGSCCCGGAGRVVRALLHDGPRMRLRDRGHCSGPGAGCRLPHCHAGGCAWVCGRKGPTRHKAVMVQRARASPAWEEHAVCCGSLPGSSLACTHAYRYICCVLCRYFCVCVLMHIAPQIIVARLPGRCCWCAVQHGIAP